ncbi:MAG: hypothetical protein Harvfovirus55_9 [Harvfovirus sp.]|uniref:Uncharacterized protein n=1 Tax=Harvfovirus sp. TaxID=2487768 RepID=A0A3G5A3H2_9VIRU|nr:MAG: hypothetical protein Harvfovirus55_9 [Harvfovirus sp.]
MSFEKFPAVERLNNELVKDYLLVCVNKMDRDFYKVVAFSEFDFGKINREGGHDWSAMYFQFTIAHALGYATDKTSSDNIICLTKFKFRDTTEIKIHEFNDAIFGSDCVTGEEKAKKIKNMLNIKLEEKLMKAINGAVILYDNVSELELIISHDMVNENNLLVQNLVQFKIKDHMLTHWRRYGNTEWIQLSPSEMLNPRSLDIKQE